LPLATYNAIEHYKEWFRINPLSDKNAKEKTLLEILELYKLTKKGDYIRYFIYRNTYFSDHSESLLIRFDALLVRLKTIKNLLPVQLPELSDLQASLDDQESRDVFSRMVFPKLRKEQRFEVVKMKFKEQEIACVRFSLTDKTGNHYVFREPANPGEVGQLYQMFFKENYPKEIYESDKILIVTEPSGRVMGGLTYQYIDDQTVVLDGVVVSSSLQAKGIATAMIENFITLLSAAGVKLIKTHFLFGNYYLKNFFKVDKRRGAIVMELE